MVAGPAGGAAASGHCDLVEGLALSCQMVLVAPLCCMLLSSRWHLDVVGRAVPVEKIDRYGNRNTAL
jgi:hypothetical protein